MRACFLSFGSCLFLAAASAAVVIDVPLPRAGTRADDALAAVRDRVRAMPATEKVGGVTVRLAPGVWSLTRTLSFDGRDSGAAGAPVTWQGAAEGRTALHLSDTLPRSAFGPVSDPSVLARLDPSVVDAIRVADVSAFGYIEPQLKAENVQTPLDIPELYFDGERMPFARWPNSGIAENGHASAWTTIPKILEKSGPNNSGGLFAYAGDRPSRWTKAPLVYLQGFWSFDWRESTMPIGAIVTSNRTIRLKYPHVFGLQQGNPSPRRWRAVHLLEELDAPGEYCFDFAAKKLYFYPPRANGRITVAGRKADIVTLTGTHDFALKDMDVEEGFANGLVARDVKRLTVEGVRFRNLFERAVVLSGTDCVIRRCDVSETGRGGIAVDGGDRKTLTPGNNLVEDCLICRFSRLQLCYANAIRVDGVGHVVRHNEIFDAPHQAVYFACNDTVFEYNVVSNVVNCSDDAGGFYKGRNPSCRGNVLRYNLWSDIGSARGHGTAAVYFDDGDVGETVYGNVFVRSGYPGKGRFGTVFVHGGFSNTVMNCIFVDCARPIGCADWGDKKWRNYVLAPLWQQRLLKDVDITKPPYITRYPDFAGFMDPQPGQARDNLALTNAFVNCADVKSGRWVTNATDVLFTGDVGFRDPLRGDYTLKSDSPIYKALPGFQPIPFDKIGLLTRRPAPSLGHTGEVVWSYRYGEEARRTIDLNGMIAAAAKRGGGRVVVPTGKWETDPIHLQSNVELHFEDGADLLFTDDLSKYLPAVRMSFEGIECYNYSPLVYAYGATNVAITGRGLISPRMGRWETWRWNGQGTRKAKDVLTDEWGAKDVPVEQRDLTKLPGAKTRPPFIGLNACRDVRLEGFTLRNSPFWCIHLLNCDDVVARGLSVSSFLNNSDGIDIECSRNVLVEDCSFDQGDDVVVLKSGKDRDGRRRATPTENVLIRRCRAGSGHGLLVVGSECSGGVRNVTMEDCLVDGSLDTLCKIKTSAKRGGFVHNITMRRVKAKTILSSVVEVCATYALNSSAADAEDFLTDIDGLTLEDVSVAQAGRRLNLCGDARRPAKGLVFRGLKVGGCWSADTIENAQVKDEK